MKSVDVLKPVDMFDESYIISSYTIVDEFIITKLMNGQTYIHQYTEENEQMIRSIMIRQKKHFDYEPLEEEEMFPLLMQPVGLNCVASIDNPGLFVSIMIAILTGTTIYSTAKLLKVALDEESIRRIIKDLSKIEKMKLDVTEAEINNPKNNAGQTFSIHSIDDYSLSELKQIKSIIHRIIHDGLKPVEFGNSKDENGKVLCKK